MIMLPVRPTRRYSPKKILGYLTAFSVISVLLLYWQKPRVVEAAVWPTISRPMLWALGYTRYDFVPTPTEAACFDGTISRHNSPGVSEEIPDTVHFLWGLKTFDAEIRFTLYLAIRAALVTLRPKELRLHYTHLNRDNPWLKRLENDIVFVHHEPDDYLAPFLDLDPVHNWHTAHLADVLRLHVLATEGGTYLDADAFALRPMDNLLRGARDVVMGHEGGNRKGLTNAVISAKKGSPFIARWLSMYNTFDTDQWNKHSVLLPRELEDKYPEELCALSPTAFFWPMWNPSAVDWLHQPLSKAEAAEVEETMRRTGGALFDDQLVIHAWSHAAAKYLPRLTPEIIRREDTRFNIVVRRFLEDGT